MIHAAYVGWATHHNECAQCGKHDWYMPGGMLLDVDPLLSAGAIEVLRNGELVTVHYRVGVDFDLLCDTGRSYFRQWQSRTNGT